MNATLEGQTTAHYVAERLELALQFAMAENEVAALDHHTGRIYLIANAVKNAREMALLPYSSSSR